MEKIEELIEKYKQDKLMARGFIVDDLGAVYKEIDEVIEDLQQLKSSLPTQQDKVVVPQCVDKFLSVGNKSQKLACLVSCKYSILTCDMAEGELKQWLREVSMDDLLSLANGYTVEKEPTTHKLKIQPEYYDALLLGIKTFEIRKNDRDFKVGDILKLSEFKDGVYTGCRFMAKIIYITDYAQQDGYVVLGIEPVEDDAE